jgi:hypothetical protein
MIEVPEETSFSDSGLEMMPEPGLNHANYMWLKAGESSFEDAKRAFGAAGIEQSSSEMGGKRIATYVWSVAGTSAQATGVFENDVLVSKSQYGLR